MKTNTKLFLTIAGLALAATTAMAQTTWTGDENNDITEALNWNNGLPTSAGNPGTINSGTVTLDAATTTGYFVTQNNGAVSGPAASSRVLNNGSWTISDGTFEVDVGFDLQAGVNGNQEFIVEGGTVDVATLIRIGDGAARTGTLDVSGGVLNANQITLREGGTFNLSGGQVNILQLPNPTGLRVNTGSSASISGGVLNLNSEIRSGGSITVTGGTTTTSRLRADTDFLMTLGGTTAGSLTANSVNTEASLQFDWLSGSQIELTIGVTNWAPTYWDDGRITYNSQNFSDLGDWATVSTTVFDWDNSTNTLALIPEPSSLALLGLAGLAAMAFRRRRK